MHFNKDATPHTPESPTSAAAQAHKTHVVENELAPAIDDAISHDCPAIELLAKDVEAALQPQLGANTAQPARPTPEINDQYWLRVVATVYLISALGAIYFIFSYL